ncbi:Uncharacterized protein AXF42_Ash009955 [Apostasia shenzhenica]|uniref:PWWP domain-containing protein n=1 Tax=Apostasia shenzhenica TaxID=1088818 RepID=A0A2I0ACI6_9ASPA|nr:Uncharacterized protein AXF42_Ash009955 [Apostasia shenzhenica]
MGASNGADGGGIGVDCSVGTIVWVRRRNGSWWPGRILGPDELSASHLMSPRSGTPVKLLGREDASVDWYNLEKSKRVKAFRCGEFDACIERAEASQGTPIKKREKYARREDAILHALELEKQQLAKPQKLRITSNGINNMILGTHETEIDNVYSSGSSMRHDEPITQSKLSLHKSQNFLMETGFAPEEENMNASACAHLGRNIVSLGWEDDNPEAIPRMRGLQDFGLQAAHSKRKFYQSINRQNSRKPVDNHVDVLPSFGTLQDGSHDNSTKTSATIKRKRLQGGVAEESPAKKRDRRRPLVQVLQSSAKLAPSQSFPCVFDASVLDVQRDHDNMSTTSKAKRSKPVYLYDHTNNPPEHGGYSSEILPVSTNQFDTGNDPENFANLSEDHASPGLTEGNESGSSETDYLEPDMGELTNMLSDTTDILLPGSKDCEPPVLQVSDDIRRLNGDEIPHSGIISQLHEQTTNAPAELGVSKWNLKGKRNVRNMGKRPIDSSDGKIFSNAAEISNGSTYEATYESKGNSLTIGQDEPSSQRTPMWGFFPKKEESQYACDEGDLIDSWRSPFSLQSTKDDGRNHGSHNEYDDNVHVLTPSAWEAGPSNLAKSSIWEEPLECFDPVYTSHFGNEMEPLLVNVDLKVQANYQGEHVPLVSLMSRLNGKAIVGHPVQIEILEDDSSSHLVCKYYVSMNENAAPQPVWRTARRTAMQRIPRSNPLTASLENEDADMSQYSDHRSKPPLNIQARLSKKGISHSRRSRSGKFQKRNMKKLSLSSQKTRTLSSLATTEKLGGGSGCVKLARSSDVWGGLIKPENSIPLVTCVPVKVVFSRLLEAVGRPSSAAAHRVRMNSPAFRIMTLTELRSAG